jgi:hypothetical protein
MVRKGSAVKYILQIAMLAVTLALPVTHGAPATAHATANLTVIECSTIRTC